MKKQILILMSAMWLFSGAYAQVNVINMDVNKNQSQQSECPFRINGICATEDIGGVDVEVAETGVVYRDWPNHHNHCCLDSRQKVLKFTNYNPYPVTILYTTKYKYVYPKDYGLGNSDIGVTGSDNATGSIVLPAATSGQHPSKTLSFTTAFFVNDIYDTKTIVRKLTN